MTNPLKKAFLEIYYLKKHLIYKKTRWKSGKHKDLFVTLQQDWVRGFLMRSSSLVFSDGKGTCVLYEKE